MNNTPHSGDWLDKILDKADVRAIGEVGRPIEKVYRDELKAQILSKHKLEVLEGRIDELNKLYTRRHYGKNYQESLDELDEYKDARRAELENERSKLKDK